MLSPGFLLEDRYVVQSVIGRGGMSTVYHCIDTRLDRDVAAKVLSSEYAEDPTFRTRFQREARAVAHLSDPSLVNIFDQGEDHGSQFLIMELVQGGTLRELLAERGPMPPHAAFAVIKPVLTALSITHRQGMIHRDIKPDNILIGDDHQVKLTDFGLVRAAKFDNNEVSNGILGTAAYLAPEQVTGDTISPQTDVYSLGIVLYELLTGELPFHGDTPLELAYARVNHDLPSVSAHSQHIPPEIEALITKATAQDPAQRFSDGQEFLDAVNDTAYSLNIPNFKVPAPQKSAVKDALAGENLTLRKSWDDTSMATNLIQDNTETAVVPSQTAGKSSEPDTELLSFQQNKSETAVLPPQGSAPTRTGLLFPEDESGYPVDPGMNPGSPDAADSSQNPPPLSNRSGPKTLLIVLVIVALIATMATGAWWLTSGRYGEVPNLVGKQSSEARVELESAGFSTDLSHRYSNDLTSGYVLSSDPAAGTRIPKSSPVTIVESLGKPTVPELKPGDTIGAYNDKLKERTLSYTEEKVYSDTVPVGYPVSVDPRPGTLVDADSSVTLNLSQGEQPVTVPDILGERVRSAVNDLKRAGLQVGSITDEDGNSVSETSRDRVTGVSIDAGTEVTKGTQVDLTVGTTQSVPNFIGMTVREAKSKANSLGVRLDTGDARNASLIYFQDPLPGTQMATEQTITVSASF